MCLNKPQRTKCKPKASPMRKTDVTLFMLLLFLWVLATALLAGLFWLGLTYAAHVSGYTISTMIALGLQIIATLLSILVVLIVFWISFSRHGLLFISTDVDTIRKNIDENLRILTAANRWLKHLWLCRYVVRRLSCSAAVIFVLDWYIVEPVR